MWLSAMCSLLFLAHLSIEQDNLKSWSDSTVSSVDGNADPQLLSSFSFSGTQKMIKWLIDDPIGMLISMMIMILISSIIVKMIHRANHADQRIIISNGITI